MLDLNYYDRIRAWRSHDLFRSAHHDGWTAHYVYRGKLTGRVRSLSVRDLGGFNLSFYHPPLLPKPLSGGVSLSSPLSNVGRKFGVADGR